MMRTWILAGCAALTVTGMVAAPVMAQRDPAYAAAREAGKVGEQADGYLGIAVGTVPADLRARVDQINIKRRAFYTDLAGQRGVSVNEVAAATACELFRNRVSVGHVYRTQAGQWATHSASAPVQMPSFCG